MLTEWAPDLITELLDDFVPDNIRIAVIAKKYEGETTDTEPWYGTEYKLENIPEDKLNVNCLIVLLYNMYFTLIYFSCGVTLVCVMNLNCQRKMNLFLQVLIFINLMWM